MNDVQNDCRFFHRVSPGCRAFAIKESIFLKFWKALDTATKRLVIFCSRDAYYCRLAVPPGLQGAQ